MFFWKTKDRPMPLTSWALKREGRPTSSQDEVEAHLITSRNQKEMLFLDTWLCQLVQMKSLLHSRHWKWDLFKYVKYLTVWAGQTSIFSGLPPKKSWRKGKSWTSCLKQLDPEVLPETVTQEQKRTREFPTLLNAKWYKAGHVALFAKAKA